LFYVFYFAAYLQITKNSPLHLIWNPAKSKVKDDSVFQRLQNQYANYQQTFYSESRSLSGGVQDGIDEVLSTCETCKGSLVGRERTQCYASCMTREMDTFEPFALQIGDAVQNFFCVPLGFGFEALFSNSKTYANVSILDLEL